MKVAFVVLFSDRAILALSLVFTSKSSRKGAVRGSRMNRYVRHSVALVVKKQAVKEEYRCLD